MPGTAVKARPKVGIVFFPCRRHPPVLESDDVTS